jgi:hypothetical protein
MLSTVLGYLVFKGDVFAVKGGLIRALVRYNIIVIPSNMLRTI